MILESIFLNPLGLLGLLFLAPLIAFYLIRPKPKYEKVPSLVFFIKDSGKSNINRLFKNFLRDLLFIIHLLIFFIIAITIAQPFITLPRSVTAKDAVILVDVSASMQTGDRFKDAIEYAKKNVASDNTIILIKSNPEVIVEHVTSIKAKSVLDNLKVTDTETDFGSALRNAEMYTTSTGKLVIVSDMQPSKGDLDIKPILDAIKSKGTYIQLYNPSPSPVINKGNIGIIDLEINQPKSSALIKNYNQKPVEVNIKIGKSKQKLLLGKMETKEIEFEVSNGVTEIEIEEDDDLIIDNKVYISTPEKSEVKILYITNRKNVEKENLATAFSLISKNFPVDIKVDYANPPKIPELNHDIYIVDGVDKNLLLPGVIKKIKENVEKGAGLVIVAQQNLFSIDFLGMLPVEYVGEGGMADVFPAGESSLTKDISFAQVQYYLKTKAQEGTKILAQTSDSPMLTISKMEKGVVVYYGFVEGTSSFSYDNSFVIFWKRLIDLLTDRPTLQNLNVRTGTILQLPKKERVDSPDGKFVTDILRTEKVGLYSFSDRVLAANLISDLESNIYNSYSEESGGINVQKEEEKAPKELGEYTLLAGILLLLLELFYIKFRGDI